MSYSNLPHGEVPGAAGPRTTHTHHRHHTAAQCAGPGEPDVMEITRINRVMTRLFVISHTPVVIQPVIAPRWTPPSRLADARTSG